jgi:hypothetical protein
MKTENYISKEDFAKYSKKVTASKESAIAFLTRVGLLDEKGRPSVIYYGRILSYTPPTIHTSLSDQTHRKHCVHTQHSYYQSHLFLHN